MIRLTFLVLLAVICCMAPRLTPAGDRVRERDQANLGSALVEVTRMEMKPNHQYDVALWIPTEMLAEVGYSQLGEPRAAMLRKLSFMKPYVLFMVKRSFNMPDGSKREATEQELRSQAVLTLPDGTRVAPLNAAPKHVVEVAMSMRGGAAAAGADGRDMYVLVFPSNGQTLSANGRSSFLLTLNPAAGWQQTTFTWETPLNALHSQHYCQTCGHPVFATWKYCAFCGQKLHD